jgi:hypothetical protein
MPTMTMNGAQKEEEEEREPANGRGSDGGQTRQITAAADSVRRSAFLRAPLNVIDVASIRLKGLPINIAGAFPH